MQMNNVPNAQIIVRELVVLSSNCNLHYVLIFPRTRPLVIDFFYVFLPNIQHLLLKMTNMAFFEIPGSKKIERKKEYVYIRK